ncbi:hypothetical protein BC332_15190 [Capsicum chinense]|nr:hypothetical protein BC332_15190 [Capsicum chinense]
MPFFLTLRSVQTVPDPKVIDGIKMELFGATTITRKITLEGGLVAIDDGSRSGAAIRDNDASLTVFKITSHYDYDLTGYIDFYVDFAISSECSACKCQDCKRISYPYTPLEINAAKRRRKDTSKASSSIAKSKIAIPLSLSCTDIQYKRTTGVQHEPNKVHVIVEATAEEHNIIIDNPSTTSKEEEKVEPECLINIIKGFSIPTGLSWHLVDEVYIPTNYGDEFHWVLVVVVLKERRIRVYDSMSRRRHSGTSSEIQKLAKILPTYLDMSGFLDQKVRTDWSTIEAYRDKMANPFDVQYIEGIDQQTIGIL